MPPGKIIKQREEAIWQKRLNKIAKNYYPDPADGFKRAIVRIIIQYGSEVDPHGWGLAEEIFKAVEAINKLVEEVL